MNRMTGMEKDLLILGIILIAILAFGMYIVEPWLDAEMDTQRTINLNLN